MGRENGKWYEGLAPWVRVAAGVLSGGLTEAANGIYHGVKNGTFQSAFDNITGKQSTIEANNATAALQEDAQDFNREEAEKQRQFSHDEAEIARQWQQEMSNTAVQRQVSDLQAAGLNPWLSANGQGASTGSVGIASGSSASSAQGQGINATESTAKSFSQIISAVAALIRAVNS